MGFKKKNRFAFRLRMSKFNGKWVTLVIAGVSVRVYPSSNFIFSYHFFLVSLSNGYSKLCWEHLICLNSPHITYIAWLLFSFFLKGRIYLTHSLRKYSLRWQGRKGRIHGQNLQLEILTSTEIRKERARNSFDLDPTT